MKIKYNLGEYVLVSDTPIQLLKQEDLTMEDLKNKERLHTLYMFTGYIICYFIIQVIIKVNI